MSKKIMKFLFAGLVALVLVACGNGNSQDEANSEPASNEVSGDQDTEDTVIRVASHLEPMTDIVEIAGQVIEEPYTIELVPVSDNIQYNEAVFNDEAYASFAQHEPFMEQFNQERNADLVAIQPIYNAIVGFYSQEYDSIEDIEDGIEIAIPSDPTNEARALQLLASYDLISLSSEVDPFFVTVQDIEENPHNFTFTLVDLLNLPASYEDGIPLVFNYPTYVEPLGLTTADAVLLEPEEDITYAQQLVVREGNVDSDKTRAMLEAFTSQEVYDFIDELAQAGHLVHTFPDPSQE